MSSDQASGGGAGEEREAPLGSEPSAGTGAGASPAPQAQASLDAAADTRAEFEPTSEATLAPDLVPQAAAPGASPAIVAMPVGAELDLPPPASVPRPQVLAAPRPFPTPRVEDLAPTEGSVLGRARVTLTGANLLRESIVRFGGMLATPLGAHGGRELNVQLPPAAHPGEVEVTVQNPGSDPVVAPVRFRYLGLLPPRLSSVAPSRGAVRGGTELSILGEGFVPETVVLFDGQEVTGVRFVDSTTIEMRSPPGVAGKLVDVAVRNPDGKTAVARRAFVYDERYR